MKKLSGKEKQRVALHEAGHLGMALLLGMRVERCSLIPGSEKWRPGERGRCTVLVPDPVGLRRFLLSLGGVMAEDLLLAEDRGGLQDRRDALEALQNYVAHYEDPGRREELDELFSRIREFFSREDFLLLLQAVGKQLQQELVIERSSLKELERDFSLLFPEVEAIRRDLESFEKTPPEKPWREWLWEKGRSCWHGLQRFRKPFEEDM